MRRFIRRAAALAFARTAVRKGTLPLRAGNGEAFRIASSASVGQSEAPVQSISTTSPEPGHEPDRPTWPPAKSTSFISAARREPRGPVHFVHFGLPKQLRRVQSFTSSVSGHSPGAIGSPAPRKLERGRRAVKFLDFASAAWPAPFVE